MFRPGKLAGTTSRVGVGHLPQLALGEPMWDVVEHDEEFAGIFNGAVTRLTALDWTLPSV